MPFDPTNPLDADLFMAALLKKAAALRATETAPDQDGPSAQPGLTPPPSADGPVPPPGLGGVRPRMPALDHGAMPVTVANGEVVELPAIPDLAHDDVEGWKDHVRQVLSQTLRHPDERWRHRLDSDAAQPYLAMGEGVRPGMGALELLLRAGVWANPSTEASIFMTIGMQEALLGLVLALGTPIAGSDLKAAARYSTHPLLMKRLITVSAHRAYSPNNLLERTPDVLHEVAANRQPAAGAIVDLLAAHGAVLDHTNQDGQSAVGDAVDRGNIKVLERLLERGVPVDLCRGHAKPPILLAIMTNREDLVVPLLAAGADHLHRDDPRNPEQHYALTTIAIKHLADRALAALVDAGLDPLVPDPHLLAHGMTSVALAHVMVQQWVGTPKEGPAKRCLDQLERLELRRTLSEEEPPVVERPRARL